VLFSVTGALLAGTIFKQIWKFVTRGEESPKARESEYGWREVLIAAAAQGAVFGLVKAAKRRSVMAKSEREDLASILTDGEELGLLAGIRC
jgi:hypothetical protein